MNMYSCTFNKKFTLATVILGLMFSYIATAQVKISLDEALGMARDRNQTIQMAQWDTEIQKAVLEQSKGNFLPYFGVQVNDIATNNPLQVFGFKLLQEEVQQSDFNPSLLNSPDVHNQFNLAFNAMMPLYNPEARSEQQAIKSRIQMTDAMAKRTMQGIELEVIQAYYMLQVTSAAIDVLEKSLTAAQSNYKVVKDLYDQGLMLQSDVLEVQVQVNQATLALGSARMNAENARAQFNYLLNNDTIVIYTVSDTLEDWSPEDFGINELNTNRADLEALRHGIVALEHVAEASRKSFFPKVRAFGSFELNDAIPFENRANNFQIGLSLNWDIYAGNRRKPTIDKTRSEIAKQKVMLEQRMAESKLELKKTSLAIAEILDQIKIHDLSIQQGSEALQIRKNRLAQGLEKSTDIITAETQLSQKKLARLNALYELNVKSAYLNFLMN